jgi:hypothetical protein
MLDDMIPAELQDLLGYATFSQVDREASASAPTIHFDENEQTVQIFESSSPINMPQGAEIASRRETPTVATSEVAGKTSPAILAKRLVGILPVVEASRHLSYVTGMIDAIRHRSAFKAIKHSEIWNDLVQSCVSFVDGRLADAN